MTSAVGVGKRSGNESPCCVHSRENLAWSSDVRKASIAATLGVSPRAVDAEAHDERVARTYSLVFEGRGDVDDDMPNP